MWTGRGSWSAVLRGLRTTPTRSFVAPFAIAVFLTTSVDAAAEFACTTAVLGDDGVGKAVLSSTPQDLRALELDPGMHRPRLGLARVALGQGDAETTRELLKDALERGAAEGEVHWLLAESYRRLGDEAAARKHFERPQPLRVLEPISDPMRETMKRDEGMTLQLIKKRCDHLIRNGQVAAAIDEWKQVQRVDPESPAVLTHLGRAYVPVCKRASPGSSPPAPTTVSAMAKRHSSGPGRRRSLRQIPGASRSWRQRMPTPATSKRRCEAPRKRRNCC